MFKKLSSDRRNLTILFGTQVVMMLGFGMIIPILPFYIEEMGAKGRDLGILMAIFAAMQLLFSPIWGDLSDRIGRRPVLMIGIFGNAVSMLFFGLSTELWMLFASRALAGILSSATYPTAMAYIGDSTSEEDRGGGMGVLGAAMGIGMVLGPGMGGWLADMSLSTPFFVAAGLSMCILVFIYFMLPESLPAEQRSGATGKLQGPDFRQMWKALWGPIGFLLFLSFLISFGMTNFEGVFGLYALNRYGYGTKQVGIILTVIGLVSALVQGLLTGPLTKHFGEERVIRASLVGSAAGFVLMLLATSFAGVLLTTAVFMLGNTLLRPAVAALISLRAEQGQGVSMGLSNSFMSMGRIGGPLWAGFALDVNLSLPYVSGAVIMALGWIATWFSLSVGKRGAAEAAPIPECAE
jgi:MFS transporter, DHA1 family, multidrug resistance protein